ncbi:hypothetical protein FHP25_29085 [Vineibacter terrae]|uniref:Tetratricopeptide repeat protein n=1 Tax=Vineibacter terrae TaxID=2586908 RepID=A0A5C8PDJ7_9HYPH|nr:hypothetical protein [Vineibacter terrae]TXL71595.1 hypothetical protein FHP25_29085 [Vineibacter terrae]
MRRLRAALAAAILSALAGCGGDDADPGPPPDLRLDQANRAGTQALAMNLPAEAIRQYRTALARAYERDDAGAIGDIGYNLAVALLRSGDGKEALRVARQTRAELERRKLPPPADLVLVQGAAAYRAGDASAAFAATGEVLASAAREPQTAARAWYIRGVILAERRDVNGVREAAGALPPSTQPGLEADRQELLGRLALMEGRTAEALAALELATQRRQEEQDYRGMARALVLAGDAAQRLGRPADAAIFLLRAGRSLVLQGDTAGGLAQLRRAEGLARQGGMADTMSEIARVRRLAAERAGP